MFALRSFSRSGKRFTNYICTSSVINCKSEKYKAPPNNEKANKKVVSEKTTFSTAKKLKGKTKSLFDSSGDTPPKETPSSFNKFVKRTVENVATDLGGNIEQTKKDLFDQLLQLDVTKEKEKPASLEPTHLQHYTAEKDYTSPKLEEIFGRKESYIFSKREFPEVEQVKLNIWNDLEREDIEYKIRLAPKNYFEELIRWTNDGKLWVFPIDNDQGAEEEAKVSFVEHVFLEKHLEPWCPKSGPLRKFMELVLIGLGKNPYLTVEEKREHINWFRTYFESKKKLLQELGALGTKKKLEPPKEESS